jgi:hypothetical protein
MSKQAKVHPLRRLNFDEQEMTEVNHYENFEKRKTSWPKLGQEVNFVSRWKTYRSSMRYHSHDVNLNRAAEGPGPRDSIKQQSTSFSKTLCVLDSDVDKLGKHNFSTYDTKGYVGPLTPSNHGRELSNEALIRSKTMIIYFAKLAKASLEEEQEIDFDFLEELLEEGADINFKDRHGQTVFHEVSRIWNIDVAKFVLENGGTVNSTDDYGRTPLHVAAAVDYPEMVEFLINNNGNLYILCTSPNKPSTSPPLR